MQVVCTNIGFNDFYKNEALLDCYKVGFIGLDSLNISNNNKMVGSGNSRRNSIEGWEVVLEKVVGVGLGDASFFCLRCNNSWPFGGLSQSLK